MNCLKRFLTLGLVLLSLAGSRVLAQPQLITTDAGNNIYPITFVDPDQQILRIEFDEIITNLGNTTGWTVTIGGTPVSLFGPIFDPSDHHIIQFQMSMAVTYANRNSVVVSYDPAASTAPIKLGGASGTVAAFGPVTAVNNLPMNCEIWDLSKFDYSQILTEVCAPVDVSYSVTYYVLDYYLNSVNYNPAAVRLYTVWGDLTTSVVNGPEISPGVFQTIFSHTYPDDPTVCFYDTQIYPRVVGSLCTGGGLRKQFTYQNHSTDDEGDGLFEMHIDTIEVCLGQDFSEIFTDATYFNCNPQTEPDYANDGPRNIRFTYGTNFAAGDRIQDILINGVPQAFPYQGSVILYDSIQVSGVPAPSGWADTDPISHVANLGTDAVGQIFEITLENWGPCNPYNIFETNPPIVTRSYIKIVDAPVAEAGPDQSICEGETATMAGSLTHTATTGYWDTNTGDGTFASATSPSGAVYTPGANDIVSGGAWLVLHASDPMSSCPDHVDSMYLTIDPLPPQPTITVNGSPNFCFDGTTSVELVSSASPNGDYAWYRNGILQPALTSQSIVLDQVAESGNWTVVVFGTTANNCPSPASTAASVNVYALATTTNPADDATCDDDNMTNGNASFFANTGGAAHTRRWQRSSNGGTSWVDITNPSIPNDGCSYSGYITETLSISSADYPMNGYMYRMKVTTTTGSCETFSAGATLTVHPVPEYASNPADATVCEFEDATFTVGGPTIASGTIDLYRWQRNNSYINAGTDGGAYTGYDTPTLTVNNPGMSFDGNRYRVVMTSDQGCSRRTSNADLNINPLADITVHPVDNNLCQGESANFTVTIDGNPPATGYQWQYSSNGGVGWVNISNSFFYSGALTNSLSITPAPPTFSGFLYRCIITSPGSCNIASNSALLTVNPLPSVSITPASPGELCNTETVNLDGNASGGTPAYTHTWTGDTGPLNSTSTETPVFTAPVLGSQTTYNLTYTVTDSQGCEDSDNVSITVNPAVTVNVSPAAPEICSGDVVNLNGNPGDGTPGYTHSWTGTGVPFLNFDNIVNPVFTSPAVAVQTTYTLTYTATDTKGCEGSQTINIVVNPLPTANITPALPAEMCFGETLNLDANAAAGTPAYTHTWTGDTGPLSSTSIVDPVFTAPSVAIQTTYDLDYTVEDSKGCVATDAVSVVVNPEVSSAVLAGNASICAGFSTDLTVTITGGVGPYTVVLNDGTSDITENNYNSGSPISTGALAATTVYTIVSVTDANGCTSTTNSGTATVIVGSVPTSAVLAGGDQICFGETTPLQVNITGGAPPYTIEIDALGIINNYTSGSDLATGVLAVGTHDYNLVEVTDVCGVSINGADVNGGNPQQIIVDPLPDISASINNEPTICNNGTTDITLTSDVANTTFTWTVDDGGGVSWVVGKEPTASFQIVAAGSGAITQNLEHTENTFVSVDYDITSAGPNPTTCPGTSESFAVVVEPTPVGAITNNGISSICNGDNVDIDITSPTVPQTPADLAFDLVVTSTNDAALGGGASVDRLNQSFPLSIASDLTNTSDEAITVTYTVTPLLSGCADGTPVVTTVVVDPTPVAVVTNNGIDKVCEGGNVDIDITSPTVPEIPANLTFDLVVTSSNDAALGGTASSDLSGQSFPLNITGDLTNSSNNDILVTYTVTPLLNGCPDGTPVATTVTVEPTPIAAISHNGVNRVCNGDNVDIDITSPTIPFDPADLTFDLIVTSTNDADLGGAASVDRLNQSFPLNFADDLTNSSDEDIVVTFTVTPGIAGCADGTPVSVDIVVEPTPVAAITNNGVSTVCEGGNVDIDITSPTIPSDPDDLTFDLVVTSTNDAALGGAASADLSNQTFPLNIASVLTNSSDEDITVTYTVTPMLNGCADGTPVVTTVVVEPDPSAAITNNGISTVCNGDNVDIDITSPTIPAVPADLAFDLVVTSTNDADLGGAAANDRLNQSFPLNISDVLTNSSDEDITVTFTVTPMLAGCSDGTIVQTTVVVEPTPIAAITNNGIGIVCEGGNVDIDITSPTIPSTPADLTFDLIVTSTNDAALGGAASADRLNQSFPLNIPGALTNSSDDDIIVTFTVTPKLAGCADGTPVSVNVTVEPDPVAAITNNGISKVCNGDNVDIDITSPTIPSTPADLTFDLVVTSTNDAALGGTASSDLSGQSFPLNISGTLTNLSNTAITVTYTVTPLLSGCADGTPVQTTVVVEPDPVAAITDNGLSRVCNGDNVNIDITSPTVPDTPADLTFDLVVTSTDDASLGGTASVDVLNQSFPLNIAGTLTNSSNDDIVVTYTVTPDLAGCGTGTPVSVNITVEPTPVAVITNNGISKVCEGDNVDIDITSPTVPSVAADLTFDLVVTSTNDAALGGAASADRSGQSFPLNITENLTNSSNEDITVTFTVTPLLNGCSDGTPVVTTVIVEPTPVALITNNGISKVCEGGNVDIDITSPTIPETPADLTFDLVVTSTNDAALGGAASVDRSGQSFPLNITDELTNSSNDDITVTFTVTPILAGCANGTPVLTVVVVEPTPIAAITNNGIATVCNNGNVDIDITSPTVPQTPADLTFDLIVTSTDDANLGGAASVDRLGQSFPLNITDELTNSSNVPITVTFTVTPGIAGCADGLPVSTDVIVYPTPTATPVNHLPVIPNGTGTDIEMDGAVAGTTFGWRVVNPGTTGATDGSGYVIGDHITQVLTNIGSTPIVVTYRIAPTANGCPGDSVDVDVQIDPSVDMTVVNVFPDICTGSNTQIDISSSVAGATFTWTVTDLSGAGASTGTDVGPNTGISIQDNLVNTGTAPVTVTYHITPKGPAPTFILGTTEDVVVTVYPDPDALPVNKSARICNTEDANITMDSDVPGTTFTWTVIDPTGGASGAASSGSAIAIGDSIFQALTNPGNTPITITYVITPTGPAPTNCPGTPVSVDVIVDPTPIANITNTNPVICSEEQTSITLNSSVAASTFDYNVLDPKGTGATGGTGNMLDVIAQTLTNDTQTPVNIIYEIIPYGPGVTACPGTAVYENVTINPLPITSEITGVDTVCETTTGLVFQVDLTTDSYYEWNVPANLGTPTFGGSGLNSNAVVITASSVGNTDSLWVFETNKYGCTKDTIYKPLTIIEFPVVSDITGPTEVCAQEQNVAFSLPENTTSTFQWFVPVGSGVVTDPTDNQVEVNFGFVSGQVRAIETSAGGCVTIHNPLNVTVHLLPNTTLNSDKIAICKDETVTFTAGPGGALNYEFFINGVSAQSSASPIFAVDSLNNNDQVTVNVTGTGGCEQISGPIQITVHDNPVATLSSSDADNTICENEEVSFTANSGTAVTYNFFLNGASVQNGPLNFYTNSSLNDGDEVYAVVMSAFGCFGTSDSITTTVNPLPVGEMTGDASICPGDVTPLTITITTGTAPYDVTIDNGIGLVNYLASPGITDVSPVFNTTYNLVSIEDANGCISNSASGNLSGSAIITVRDTVEIITQPADEEVCEFTDASFTVSASGDGLVYQWEYTDDLANAFAPVDGSMAGHTNFDQATMTIIGADPVFDGYYYRVRITGTCPEFAISDTAQLDIIYDPISARDPYDQLICEGESTGFGVDAGITEDPDFQWQLSIDNGSNWSDLADTAIYSGSHTDSLIIAAASSRFNGYQYRVIITGDCGGFAQSAAAILTVDERPEILEQPADTTVCENNPVEFSVDAGVTTNPVYQWQVNMNDGNGFVDIPSDTAGVYSGYNAATLNVLNAATRFDQYSYRVIVGGDCPNPVTSSEATLNVNEIPEITTQPLDSTVCEGESPFFTVNAGVTTGALYQWQVSSNGGGLWEDLADTAIYNGSNTSILRLLSVPSSYDGYMYHVIISGICAPDITSNDVLLTVRERPEILEHPEDTVVCESEPVSFSVDAGVTSGVVYQWQVDMGMGFSNIGMDSAGIYSGYDQDVLNVLNPTSRFNGYRYRVRVSGLCTPSQNSSVATLNIYEKAEIISQPVDKTICEDNNTFFIVNAGVTSGPTYQWEVNMGSGFTVIGSDTSIYSGSGTSTLILNTVPSSFNGYIYRVIVGGICPDTETSTEVNLTVNDQPEILIQPVNDTVCENDPAVFTVDAGVTTGVIYEWYVNKAGLWQQLTVADEISGEYTGVDSDVLTVNNPGSEYNGYQYRVIIRGVCTPSVTSETVRLIIDERPEIITEPVDRTVCENDDAVFIVNAGSTTNPVYAWEYTSNGTDWFAASDLAEVSDATDDSLVIASVPSGYDGYMLRVSVSGKCPASVTSTEVNLTVNERPEILVQPVSEDVCEQDTVMFFVDAGVTTNAAYQWQIYNGSSWVVPSSGIYSGTNDDTLYINGVNSSINGAWYRVIVSGECDPSVISDTAVLTVYERPEILGEPLDMEICENDDAYFGLNAGVTTNASFKWEYFDGTVWQTATGGIFVNEMTDTLLLTNVPASWDGTLFRGIVYGECEPSDTTVEVTLFIRNRPEITSQPVSVITCEGIPAVYTVDAGATYSPSYQWQYHDGVSGWQNTSGANYSGSNTASLTINNPGSTMSGYAYRVVIDGFCNPQIISDSVTLTIEENPELILQPVDAVICELSDTSFTVDAGVTTDPVYTWYYDDGSGYQVVTADAVHSGVNSSTLNLTSVPFSMDNYRYYVEVSGKCGTPVTSDRVNLVVYKSPEITLQPRDTAACELSNVRFSIETGDTDGAFIQWEVNDGVSGWQPVLDGGNYTGVNSEILRVYSIDSAMTGYQYHAVVSGTCESPVTSDDVTLTVYSAPKIWSDPEDISVCENTATVFEVLVTGSGIIYQWQVDMLDGSGFRNLSDTAGIYSGTDTDMLNVLNPDRRFNGYRYRLRVEGNCNPAAISQFAILTVSTGPEIIADPVAATICEFSNVSFSVSAQGLNLSYIWQENSTGTWLDLQDTADYIGTNTPTMSIFNVPASFNGNRYRVIVSGSCPSPAVSAEAELILKTSPVITVQPVDADVCEDNNTSFTVTAEGSELEYQWQVSTGAVFFDLTDDGTYSGTDSPTLIITNTPLILDGNQYRVRVSGACKPAVNSTAAILNVSENPEIVVDPVPAEICEGANTSFISGATGSEIAYQWQVSTDGGSNWSDLAEDGTYSGVSSSTLSIINAPVSLNNNQYRLSVTSACITVNSAAALLTVNSNPTANITGDGTFPLICGGFDLNLDGNPSGGSGTYTDHDWTGDTSPLSVTNSDQTVFYSLIKGSYDLVYTVTDSKGCKGSSSVTIENDIPNAQFNSDATPECGDLTVNFTNTSTGAVSYEWHFDDGTPVETTQNAVHGFDNLDPSGLVKYFDVKLVAFSANGCRDTANQIITVYPKVDPTFEVDPDTACQPITATLVTQPGASSYLWDFGDGSQESAGYTVLHTFVNTTTSIRTYTIKLTTTSFYGCKASSTKSITVYPKPTPNFTVAPVVQTYPEATVTITNLVNPGPWTYNYNFGDGNTSSDENPVHTYAEPGTYTIVQTVSAGECSDSIGQSVVINPTPPIAGFQYPNSGCTPWQVQFVNTSLYANSYLWDFGDGSISTKKDPVYTYFEEGVYSVKLTVNGPGGSASFDTTFEVWATPAIFFNNAPDSVYVNDKPVKFFNFSRDAAIYKWNFGDYDEETGTESSSNTSNEYEPSHIYQFVGWKDVKLIGLNEHCSDTLLVEEAVYVSPAGALQFPNVFKPNPNGPTGGYYDPNDPSSVNSVFFPGVIDQVLEYDLYIYNRWGELIFHSSDINRGWDGYINNTGRLAKQGVYIWKVKGKYTNGKNFVEEGDVTLLH